MASKPKTIRLIEPNAGTQRQYAKKLKALTRNFQYYVLRQILIQAGKDKLTNDALPRLTLREKLIFEDVKRALSAEDGFNLTPTYVDRICYENIARWLIDAKVEARRVSYWFAQVSARDVTASQRRALRQAGISDAFLDEKWTIPVIKGQYISPKAKRSLDEITEHFTGLITKMQVQDVERVQTVLKENIRNGGKLWEVYETLRQFDGFDDARAKRVALDQSLKINQAVQQENSKAIGITEGIWKHVPGQYTSRQTHKAFNGQRFDLSKGLYDSDVDKYVLPGELYYCRCSYRSVLPPELLNNIKKKNV